MAVTQIKICNSALINLGADLISSITQDTRSANLLNAIWDEARDAVMAAHPWNFAIKRVTLTVSSTTPDWGYDYQYDLPSDCLRFLTTDPDSIDFVVENGKLLTSDESQTLDSLYIFRNTDESSWSPNFAEAFGWYLTSKISYALTQSLALCDAADKQYRRVLAEARSMDGAEGVMKPFEADTWTTARR